jgi:hypothetical protein
MTSTEALIPMVTSVTQEVLETMFFSEAEAVACGHESDWIAARVRFSGDPSGELTVMLSRELALAASAGFLAEDAGEVTAEQLNQVSCELANIICGAILSRLHPQARVTLGVPELAHPDFGDAVHQCFATPEGMLAVTIRMG